MTTLHVAATQIQSRRLQPVENLSRFERQARAAAILGVEVLLGAETCLHAYDLSAENLALAESLDGPLTQRLQALADELDMVLLAGMLERDGDRIYNSQVIAVPGKAPRSQRKHNLTPGEIAAGIAPGPRDRTPVMLKGLKCAIVICADGGIDGLPDDLRRDGYDYRFCPTTGGDMIDGKKHRYLDEAEMSSQDGRDWYLKYRHTTFMPDAIMDLASWHCGFTAANALGYDGGDVTHQGHCMIVDNNGIMRAQVPGTTIREHQQDQLIHCCLNFP